MKTKKQFGFYLMILVIISETVSPFILGHFYPHFNQLNMLMSDFGEAGKPTRSAFKIWQIIDGSIYIISAFAFYQSFKNTSKGLAKLLTASIILYALGDCIITGIADRVKNHASIVGRIHSDASALSLLAIWLGIIILILLYKKENNDWFANLLKVILAFATAILIIYSKHKIPILKEFRFPLRGLTQKLCLYSLFLPFLLVALDRLKIVNFNHRK
ncbi:MULTISPECIES: DUF998 domain-containing protein [unclassified Enterococcus]|uniref:DUF998 domain-containing protein n=1 Tax=unclassified Enterococcus TaxID=2608891 RepID=UPI00155697E5|nr:MULTISPECIES: DUF998 domain-containing protein [unclassified Enterococcus]MBS7577797.1 DUF998 domain-containing protein [Enterococcus sp. MMGLQ5-2]MBS7585057.1 DUF998 domain-containing protein [Enterococcus sp. MMGLQ5-1]NPD12913.1 DUF998 domain-containing protein [Enterococcus sp. MMGLQ5-1]NPD37627.1 DUF998 domain-containing protein [Enterococcus sp. MMGLQ5-2]